MDPLEAGPMVDPLEAGPMVDLRAGGRRAVATKEVAAKEVAKVKAAAPSNAIAAVRRATYKKLAPSC